MSIFTLFIFGLDFFHISLHLQDSLKCSGDFRLLVPNDHNFWFKVFPHVVSLVFLCWKCCIAPAISVLCLEGKGKENEQEGFCLCFSLASKELHGKEIGFFANHFRLEQNFFLGIVCNKKDPLFTLEEMVISLISLPFYTLIFER